MTCPSCGHELASGARFCGSCGAPAGPPPAPARPDAASLADTVLVDGRALAATLRSPVFLFLSFVAIVPLAIPDLFSTAKGILYGFSVWSGVLWTLLLYRLFSDRDLELKLALGTAFFTCFIGLTCLEVYLRIPLSPLVYLVETGILPLELIGHTFGTGVREELTKALPLLLLAAFTRKLDRPLAGLVLGMTSGVGFAAGENVLYVYLTLENALAAFQRTGNALPLVVPVFNNVLRMAMTPFLHGCMAGLFGYFISLAVVHTQRRIPYFLAGLGLSSFIHGCFDTFVGRWGVAGLLIEAFTFLLLLSYVLKARGLSSAAELGGGVFQRTVMMRAPRDLPELPAPRPAPPPRIVCLPEPPPLPGSDPAAPGRLRLRGAAGLALGRTHLLDGELRLGRDAQRCQIHLEEPSVSREHAVFMADPQGCAVQRISRTGPLYVNGQAVEEAWLAIGDQVQAGSSVFLVEAAD